MVGFLWYLDSTDRVLERRMFEQDRRLTDTESSVEIHGRTLDDVKKDLAAEQESNRRQQAELEVHTREFEQVRTRLQEIDHRIVELAAQGAKVEALVSEQADLRERLRQLTARQVEDDRALRQLREEIDALRDEHEGERGRLQRIERILGIEQIPPER